MPLRRLLLATTLLAAASMSAVTHATANRWVVVPADSKIAFSGTHAGAAFKGTFQKWEAAIVFDPANLAAAKAVVTVALASAKTGDTTYDKTLPTADWFDVAKGGANGTFETGQFRALGESKFEADGTLAIRGLKMPVTLVFDFVVQGDTAKLIGKTQVKRLDFAIGKGSDASGAWVSLDIPVEVSVSLKKD